MKSLLQNEEFAHLYPQGLDFMSWLEKPATRPDEGYLLSAAVSCPLIAVTQLAHYYIICKIQLLTPGEHLLAVAGHSQGIVTSLAIGLSDSWESFMENSLKAVSLMLFVGARTALKFPLTVLSSEMVDDSFQNGEGRPTPMLIIRDLSLDQVEGFVTQTNKDLPESRRIAISLYNGATNLVLSGPPKSLYSLNLILRKIKAPNGVDVAPAEAKFKFSNQFLSIYAPFNSCLLKDTYKLIAKDITNSGIEFSPLDIKVPVYDTYNGDNLQEYESTQECSLTSRVVKLITELPVHWEAVPKFTSTDVVELGQIDSFGLSEKIEERVEYAIFSGTGFCCIYDALERHYKFYIDLTLEDFLTPICDRLKELIQSDSSIASQHPKGLDFLNWLQNPEQRPNQDYLLTTPVSCPLATLIQLADYCLQCKIMGLDPGQYSSHFAGAAGPSQGIIAAVVIDLSDSWNSFLKNSLQAVSLMLFIGARTGPAYESAPLEMSLDTAQNAEGVPSSMLVVVGIALQQVKEFITQANKSLSPDKQVCISVFNSPKNFGVTGPPESLYELTLILRKLKAPKVLVEPSISIPAKDPSIMKMFRSMFIGNQSQNKIKQAPPEKPETPLDFSYGFHPIFAPFHSHLLKDSFKIIVEDLTNSGIEFSSKDSKIPVYDTNIGANLQDYDNTDQEYLFTSRLVKLITELPVHWEAAINFGPATATRFGSQDILDAVI